MKNAIHVRAWCKGCNAMKQIELTGLKVFVPQSFECPHCDRMDLIVSTIEGDCNYRFIEYTYNNTKQYSEWVTIDSDQTIDVRKFSLECLICFEALEIGSPGSPGEIVACKSCSHCLHYSCLQKWKRKGNITCPLCRNKSFKICSKDSAITKCHQTSDDEYQALFGCK